LNGIVAELAQHVAADYEGSKEFQTQVAAR
jgi:hypothetical protein